MAAYENSSSRPTSSSCNDDDDIDFDLIDKGTLLHTSNYGAPEKRGQRVPFFQKYVMYDSGFRLALLYQI